jgi:hypothetical protein
MNYMNPTDARIALPNRVRDFLKGDERLLVVIGPLGSGRSTILEETFERLGIEGKVAWTGATSETQFYQSLNEERDAELVVLNHTNITFSINEGDKWSAETLRRLSAGDTLEPPDGDDDRLPERFSMKGKLVLLAESQANYDPVWSELPGIAYDESLFDLHNYLRRKRNQFAEKHDLPLESIDAVLGYIRDVINYKPERFTKPDPGSDARMGEILEAVRGHAEGGKRDSGGDWEKQLRFGVLQRAHSDSDGEDRNRTKGNSWDFSRFHVVDGLRGRLILPAAVDAFLNGKGQFFSLVESIHVQGSADVIEARIREAELPMAKVKRFPTGGGDAELYEALVKANEKGVLFLDRPTSGDFHKEEVFPGLHAMLLAVSQGEAIKRPSRAGADLPESITFKGKVILRTEHLGDAIKDPALLTENPGLYTIHSISDSIHTLLYGEKGARAYVEQETGQAPTDDEWRAFMDQLFRFLEQGPSYSLKRMEWKVPMETVFLEDFYGIIEEGLMKSDEVLVRSSLRQWLDAVKDHKQDTRWTRMANEAALPSRKP